MQVFIKRRTCSKKSKQALGACSCTSAAGGIREGLSSTPTSPVPANPCDAPDQTGRCEALNFKPDCTSTPTPTSPQPSVAPSTPSKMAFPRQTASGSIPQPPCMLFQTPESNMCFASDARRTATPSEASLMPETRRSQAGRRDTQPRLRQSGNASCKNGEKKGDGERGGGGGGRGEEAGVFIGCVFLR